MAQQDVAHVLHAHAAVTERAPVGEGDFHQRGLVGNARAAHDAHERGQAQFAGLPLEFEPGTSWAYNNSGYFILGRIIENVTGEEYDDALKKELVNHVRKEIGPIASPDVIHWAPGLPKTRSGKIMRRILRKIAAGEYEGMGDTSTLAEPEVVDRLIADHKGRSA